MNSASGTCWRAASGPQSTSLRVTGRLLDAETGAVLWSQAYDDDLQVRDFFAIQDDVAQKVATAVASPTASSSGLTRGGPRPGAPEDLEAYACTLRFYGYRAALGPGEPCRDPDLPRTGGRPLSELCHRLGDALDALPRRGSLRVQSATPARRRRPSAPSRPPASPIRLDPENVRALQALMMALFFAQQPVEALEVGERAVALNPNDTELLAEFGSRVGQAGAWTAARRFWSRRSPAIPGH